MLKAIKRQGGTWWARQGRLGQALWLTGLASLLVLGGALKWLRAASSQPKPDPKPTAELKALKQVAHQLRALRGQVDQLTQKVAKPPVITLKPIQKQLAAHQRQLNQKLESLNKTAVKNLPKFEAQIKQLRQVVQARLAKPTQKQPKPVKALPFQVVAVARWQQRPMVTLTHTNELHFLYVGEHLAGWTLQQANIKHQTATFVNQQGQSATVALQKAKGRS